MTTAPDSGYPSSAPSRTTSALERWSLLGGALYVVLFIVGTLVSFSGQPDTGSSPEKLIRYWSDSGHRNRLNVGWILVGLGVFFFIWFVGALRQRMRDADAGFLATVITVGGAVYATSTMAAFSLEAGIKTMSDDTYHHQVFPELIHAADDAGWVIHAGGAVGVSALTIATSVAAMRLGRLSRGLGIVSIVAGVISLAAVIFFPAFVIALWILITSIVMFIRSSGETAPA
ncbi:MAG: hypothetical protein ABR498_04260 [Candidatus Dormibacteria bacterium]